MNNSESFYGSICITDLLDKLREKHSSFTKAKNNKIYCNITVWLNEEKDEYGNVMAIQANPTKEMKDKEKKFYLGNCKKSDRQEPKPISDKDLDGIDNIDLSVSEEKERDTPVVKDEKDDLPF